MEINTALQCGCQQINTDNKLQLPWNSTHGSQARVYFLIDQVKPPSIYRRTKVIIHTVCKANPKYAMLNKLQFILLSLADAGKRLHISCP